MAFTKEALQASINKKLREQVEVLFAGPVYPRVTVVILKNGKDIAIGVAKCHPKDTYNLNKGVKLALDRALAFLSCKLMDKKVFPHVTIVPFGESINVDKLVRRAAAFQRLLEVSGW